MLQRSFIQSLALACLLLCPASVYSQVPRVLWDPSPDPTVTGYSVVLGTTSGVYTTSALLDKSVCLAGVCAWPIPSPVAGQRYYAAVASVASGVVGPRSLEVTGIAVLPQQIPVQTSPDGTLGTTLIDCTPALWTLSEGVKAFRNGIDTGGRGSIYKLLSCVVWIKGNDLTWWSWNGTAWIPSGQTVEPGTVQSPPTDTTAPAYSMNVGRRTGNNYPVTLTNVLDPSGIDHVEFWVNQVMQVRLQVPTTAPTTWAARVQIKTPGTHLVEARVYDAAGNMAGKSLTVQR